MHTYGNILIYNKNFNFGKINTENFYFDLDNQKCIQVGKYLNLPYMQIKNFRIQI